MGELSVKITPEMQEIGVWAKDRATLMDWMVNVIGEEPPFLEPPVMKIKMACGHEMWITGVNDAPHESVPCTCGNPNHWFVKYGEEWV